MIHQFNDVRSKLVRKLIKGRLSRPLSKLARRRVVVGFDEFCTADVPRRALVSYLVLPFLLPPAYRKQVVLSNHNHANSERIAQVLNELGFVLDIVNFDNPSWLPSRQYDLFVGHGGINFEHISRHLSDTTHRIYFSSGIYWWEFNIREAKRFYELAVRKGHLLPPDRSIEHSEEYANQVADGVICLGNREAARTYSDFPNVFNVNMPSFPVTWEGWHDKDYNEGRKHFLFFSGAKNVHKGLGLLLEAFSQIDLHLHICQRIESNFARVYQAELNEFPNIHLHGFIQPRSPQFEALAMLCNWIMLPTCAEGQPGSVIECMGYGLIPILPDSANIDLEEWGVRLPDCEVETISSIAIQVSQMEVEESRQRTAQVVKATRESYTGEGFRAGFKQAVRNIISST